ncbi:hypothetical protein L1987_05454 [Smallanthus sonchifolius]|uniref:Uncharacterized protein n=1 Tax=Smallanthus sonchifolius TaxID=185202 RepID=A0ACB9JVD7_9ASTR|nr:hypothetical protein L1987_05454 [Smallanthus sonchifolius]
MTRVMFVKSRYGGSWSCNSSRSRSHQPQDVQVPPSIDPIVAAAAIFKGLTDQVLVRQCFMIHITQGDYDGKAVFKNPSELRLMLENDNLGMKELEKQSGSWSGVVDDGIRDVGILKRWEFGNEI